MDKRITDINSRDDLAELVRGLSDGDIESLAGDYGVDRVLERIFEQMERDFEPSKGPRRPAIVQWDVVARDRRHVWQMSVTRDTCSIEPGLVGTPTVTLTMSVPVFLKIIARVASGPMELARGKVKLKGNLVVAASMDNWFTGDGVARPDARSGED